MAAAVAIGVLGLLPACSDEAEPVATGGELIVLQSTSTTSPPTVPTTTAPPATSPDTTEPEPPVDPVDGCINWYRFKIEAEDEEVFEFWEDELDEDLVLLVAECERLAAEDPDRVQEMIAESKAIDEFLRQMAAQESTPTSTDP